MRGLPGRRRAALTLDETIELLIGRGSKPSRFLDDADMERAWRDHRDDLMETRPPGQRAWAWWAFDAPEPRDSGVSEAVQLMRLGLLRDDERRALAGDWLRSERWARHQAQSCPVGRVSPIERARIYSSLRDLAGVPPEIPGSVDDLAEGDM